MLHYRRLVEKLIFNIEGLVRFRCRNFATQTHDGSASPAAEITPLYQLHVDHGGKMVNFGGFLLPVQYSDMGIAASHLHTREKASLFDVSHMLQTEIIGPGCIDYLESVCTADLKNLPDNSSVLTVFTNDQGGILDDLIVTKIADDHLYVVSNAAMRKQDMQIMSNAMDSHQQKTPQKPSPVAIKTKFFEPMERALIAIQGPKAAATLQPHTDVDLSKLYFMTSSEATVCECGACRITRCGYTGEDGFEISIPSIKAIDVTEELLRSNAADLKLAGLGARDSLRLEAGLCLYGNDITPETTPVEAALTWLIAKRRRQAADFPGASTILKQIKEGTTRKRIGLVMEESGPPARHGCAIIDNKSGHPVEVGVVTSGCPSPSLNKNIAMGYVPSELSKPGTGLSLKIRDKLYGAVVTKMPFVESKYYSKPRQG